MNTCKRVGKNTESRDLALQGLNFFLLDGASCLLGFDMDIYDASRLLFCLLDSLEMPYDKALYWVHFTYTGDQLRAYMSPGSTEL